LDLCPTILMVLRRLGREALDIVHLHTPNPTMLMPLVAGCAVPLVVTHHSDIVRQKLLRHMHAPFERIVYGRAQALLSDSAGYIEGSAVLQRYRTKVEALPLGIDLDPYLAPSARALAFRDTLRATHGGPLWLSVCRLVYYKGIEVALEALRHVAGKLIVIGTGPLEAALRQRAEAFGVADRVIWFGHADPDQLVGAYQAATAFWFPSVARSEGFGLVQVEAMASGCPVINTAIPGSGVPWVSLHDLTGLTVPVGNTMALAAAAQRLLDEDGLRDQLGRQGRERACSDFAEQKMAERSLDIYSRVLSRVCAG
jgi:glycosyltransferase involved in cell wall biosynthesis